ncbi:MAG: DUF4422 domain-containing protein [Phascolarctobacterium sp.]|nr:DUF4422 domain-containing protein [Phascolarctobacterium sp.]
MSRDIDLKIIVATHKKYWMPEEDTYLPLHVGKAGKESIGFTSDATGDNISLKNSNYCELTGLYWAWKNLHNEYLGLCHYRRYLGHFAIGNDDASKKNAIFTKNDYEKILSKYDIVLPRGGRLLDHTIKTDYEYHHKKKDFDEIRKIISDLYPEYVKSFDVVVNQNLIYFCNMFVMNKKLADEYCSWLFDILFELERRIDISDYDNYQARIYGFLSERLLNVWIYHKKLKIYEATMIQLEDDATNNGNIIKRVLKYCYFKMQECFLLDV